MLRRNFFRWFLFLALVALSALACNLSTVTETPPAPVVETAVVDQPATAEPPATTENPPVVVPSVTTAPTTLAEPAETEQPPATPTLDVTAEPTATVSETVEAPTQEPGTIAPGQQSNGILNSGEAQLFTFQGTRFKPVLVFVEGDDTLNLAISAYSGTFENEADLAQTTPLGQANFSPAGLPEALVISPAVDGAYTVVVQSSGDSTGEFNLYLFDGTTPAPNAQLINDSLAAGETKQYPIVSNDGRPVIVFADQTGQSDLVIQILFQSGTVAGEADFGGTNSAESLYVLPGAPTNYTVTVSTANGEAAQYDLVIVTLD